MKLKFTVIVFLVLSSLTGIRAQKLWGVASSGVADNKGVVFNANSDGTGYAVQHNFVSDFSGGTPTGSLTYYSLNGSFYGLTSQGGDNGVGIIFKYEVATGIYTKLHSFQTAEGTGPMGSLLLAGNGKFYGLTFDDGGGAAGGTIFEFDPTNNAFTKKLTLGPSTGQSAMGSLVQANSKLYGLTWSDGGHAGGTILEYDIASNAITFQYDLTPATEGSNPMGDLVLGNDGFLYGMTSTGGAAGKGTLFRFDPASHVLTKLRDFTGTSGLTPGSSPAGSLILASDGFVYGLTSTGGANNKGVLFQLDYSSNVYTVKKDLADATGSNPQGTLMQASNGKLYGTTLNGGSNFLARSSSMTLPETRTPRKLILAI